MSFFTVNTHSMILNAFMTSKPSFYTTANMHSGPEQANSISYLHKALKVKHKAKSLLFQSNHDKLLVFSAI